jgi:glycosyltransferase involved in cell wall biosynthesis
MHHQVSVIVPVWNMARFLPDAIASIPDVHEILIVVAESDDDTLAVANELARQRSGIVVLDNPKKTPAAARNIGLRHAGGDVIAFNDADDLWTRGRLELQLGRLDRQYAVDMVSGLVTFFDLLDQSNLSPAASSRCMTIFTHQVTPAIFRRSVFDRIGLFDESLLYAEDRDILLRIIESGIPFVILKTPTLYYRRHGDCMMTRDLPRQTHDDVRAFALSIARRRRLGQSLSPLSFESYFETPVQQS